MADPETQEHAHDLNLRPYGVDREDARGIRELAQGPVLSGSPVFSANPYEGNLERVGPEAWVDRMIDPKTHEPTRVDRPDTRWIARV